MKHAGTHKSTGVKKTDPDFEQSNKEGFTLLTIHNFSE